MAEENIDVGRKHCDSEQKCFLMSVFLELSKTGKVMH